MVSRVCVVVSGSGGTGMEVFLVALQPVVPVEALVEELEVRADGLYTPHAIHVVPCASPGFFNESSLCDGISDLHRSSAN